MIANVRKVIPKRSGTIWRRRLMIKRPMMHLATLPRLSLSTDGQSTGKRRGRLRAPAQASRNRLALEPGPGDAPEDAEGVRIEVLHSVIRRGAIHREPENAHGQIVVRDVRELDQQREPLVVVQLANLLIIQLVVVRVAVLAGVEPAFVGIASEHDALARVWPPTEAQQRDFEVVVVQALELRGEWDNLRLH